MQPSSQLTNTGMFKALVSCAAAFMAFMPLAVPVWAAGSPFVRTLKIGMSGEDVRQLQVLLNADPLTAIQGSGPGSPGQETDYFGSLTYAAVVRFQEKYRDDILVPNGLSSGTGVVGASTEKKLATLASATLGATYVAPIPSVSTTASSSYMTPLDKEVVSLMSAKVDQQTVGIADSQTRQNVKTAIMAQLDQSIKDARNQASLPHQEQTGIPLTASAQTSGWAKILDTLGYIFPGFVAYAASPSGANSEETLAQLAGTENPFGGMYVLTLQCTCADDNMNYVLDYASDNLLSLLYEPGSSLLFMNYDVYGTFQKGSYAQASGGCQIETGPSCTTINADGQYGHAPGTGTS